jgi:hypothetical protein
VAVAEFYQLDPANWGPTRRLAFLGNIPRLRAARALDEISKSGQEISPKSLFALTLAATEDESQAQDATTAYVQRLIRAGRKINPDDLP